MNPATEDSKTLNRVTLKRRRTLSRPRIWRLVFRYVRVPLILVAIGCSLSYWHERFQHPITDAEQVAVFADPNSPAAMTGGFYAWHCVPAYKAGSRNYPIH